MFQIRVYVYSFHLPVSGLLDRRSGRSLSVSELNEKY